MDGAGSFVSENPQATLVTHRHDGGIQASPIRVLVDSDGAIVACTRESTAKAHNLARDPRFALCVTTKEWVGPWITIEGIAKLVHLPEAIEMLRAFYLQRDGSVLGDPEFSDKMKAEERLIIRFHVERTAGTASV